MTRVQRWRVDFEIDQMADCCCRWDIVEDNDGDYVRYSDYMKLLREYSEAVTNEGDKTCANPTCDRRADMYLGNRAYCCTCLQPKMGRVGTDG